MLLVLDGRLCRNDARSLEQDVTRLLDGVQAEVALCDIGHLVGSDLAALDAVVRLQLTGRRLGVRIAFQRTPAPLLRLVRFLALIDVLPIDTEPPSGSQAIRKPEQWKQPVRIQERVDGHDLAVDDVQRVQAPRLPGPGLGTGAVLAKGRRAVRDSRQ